MNGIIIGAILGLIQGISEWLPISSKTQVTVASISLLHLTFSQAYTLGLFFEIGTILAAVIYFRKELLSLVETLNADKSVHGILVQVPLPNSIDPLAVQQAIHPYKDVDGFGTKSMGLLLMGVPRFVAATPAGIMRLLSHYHFSAFSSKKTSSIS